MVRLNFEVSGVRQVSRALALSADAVKDLRPVWDDIYDDFLDREGDVFDREGASGSMAGPGSRGQAWKEWEPLNEDYAKRKAAEGYGSRILVRTGALRTSLTARDAGSVFHPGPRSVSMGTSIPYAGYHQTGTRRMPRREPIRISEAAARHWARLIQLFVIESGQFERREGF